MSTSAIKLVAIATMLIDHIGFVFFPQLIFLRAIGRLSFILFAFLIANGAIYTHDFRNYFLRMLAFALISQLPFILMLRIHILDYWGLNVLFTFILSLLGIYIIKNRIPFIIKLSLVFGIIVLADFFKTDYGGLGVLSVLSFYLFFKKKAALIISQVLIFGVLFPTSSYLETPSQFFAVYNVSLYQPIAIISLFFILIYSNKKGFGLKYFFYIFYPLHMALLWGLYVLINK